MSNAMSWKPGQDQRDGWVQGVEKLLRGEKVKRPSKKVWFCVSIRQTQSATRKGTLV